MTGRRFGGRGNRSRRGNLIPSLVDGRLRDGFRLRFRLRIRLN